MTYFSPLLLPLV